MAPVRARSECSDSRLTVRFNVYKISRRSNRTFDLFADIANWFTLLQSWLNSN